MLAHFEIVAALTDSRTDIFVDGGCASGSDLFWLCVFHVGSDLPCGSSICLRPCGSDVTQVQEHFNTSSGPCIAAGTMCSKFWIYVPIIYNSRFIGASLHNHLCRSPYVRILQSHSPVVEARPQVCCSALFGWYPTAVIACCSVIPSDNRRLKAPNPLRRRARGR